MLVGLGAYEPAYVVGNEEELDEQGSRGLGPQVQELQCAWGLRNV